MDRISLLSVDEVCICLKCVLNGDTCCLVTVSIKLYISYYNTRGGCAIYSIFTCRSKKLVALLQEEICAWCCPV